MPSVMFQVAFAHDFHRKFQDPQFWVVYRAYVLREITEGALEHVRGYAGRLWKQPTGKLDQSWFSRYNHDAGIGYIANAEPYAYWLNFGVRPHRMWYLLHSQKSWYLRDGARAVTIPLKADRRLKGEVTFRVMTEHHERLPEGKGPWWHRGIEPKKFLEKGMEEYAATKLPLDFEGLIIRVLDLP